MSDTSTQPTNNVPVGETQSLQSASSSSQEQTQNLGSAQQNGNNNQNNQMQLMTQPKFHQIIDVIVEYQKGNFLPALHCLKYNLIPKDFLDFSGYNILHHAVSYNNIPLVLILLDYFKIDVNIPSKNNQTALMIACNYGFTEIIGILCDRGASINDQEDTKFSAILYTVKQGWIPHFCYLLYQNADIHSRDANGCTIVHWAAYKNNLFLLRLLKRIGMDLNVLDSTGLTPLDRAVQSDAYEAVKYLVENGDGKIPANMKLDEIYNPDIKGYLRRQYLKTKKEQMIDQLSQAFDKNSQMITFGVYGFLWLFMMIIYVKSVMNQGFNYVYDLVFLVFGLFFIFYAYWYYLKSLTQIDKVKKFAYQKLHLQSETTNNERIPASYQMSLRLNFEALNKLVHDEKETVIQDNEAEAFPTFLHELAYQFKMKNYREINKFEAKDYCPTCLVKRQPRSKHPKHSKTCVNHFHHYSEILHTSIHKKNHLFYLILLIKQMALLSAFLIAVFAVQAPNVQNRAIFLIEVGYHLGNSFGLYQAIFYSIFVILAAYNLFFLTIELYGIIYNLTYNELFNRNRYSYLFKIKLDPRGSYVKYFNNPYDRGIWNNIKEYFSRSFQ